MKSILHFAHQMSLLESIDYSADLLSHNAGLTMLLDKTFFAALGKKEALTYDIKLLEELQLGKVSGCFSVCLYMHIDMLSSH